VKAGFVLSGGGATGAYEVGILKALLGGHAAVVEHRQPDVATVAATSIGAFNASVLLSNYDGQDWGRAVGVLESVWLDRVAASRAIAPNGVYRYRPNFLDWMNPSQWLAPWQPARMFADDAAFLARDSIARLSDFVAGSGGLAHRFAELIDISAFITPDPSERLVRESIVPARIRDSPVRLRVTATQWEKGTLRVFGNSDFSDRDAVDIVRASGAIPGFFPPVAICNEPYVDGGVVLNTPLKPAIDAGGDVLHVIYLDPDAGAMPVRRVGSTIDTIGRMFVESFAATLKRDLEVAAATNREVAAGHQPTHRPITIHLYHPHHDTGGALGMLDFDRERIQSLAGLGYRDALAHDCGAAGCLNVGSGEGAPRATA